MARYVAGDADAFRVLFDRYAPRLTSLMRRQLFRPQDATDLVQQTFLQLHRARRDFRPDSKLRPWLYTIALNLKRKYFRTHSRRPTTSLEIEPEGEDTSPDAPAIQAETIAAVREALQTLPENQRTVIELHWFEGLPFAEVAQVVGAKTSAVKVRAHRGYKRLKEQLGDLSNPPRDPE